TIRFRKRDPIFRMICHTHPKTIGLDLIVSAILFARVLSRYLGQKATIGIPRYYIRGYIRFEPMFMVQYSGLYPVPFLSIYLFSFTTYMVTYARRGHKISLI